MPPVSVPPAQPRNERQLVFTSSQAARYVRGVARNRAPLDERRAHRLLQDAGWPATLSRAQLDEFIRLDAAHRRLSGAPAA